MCLLHEGYIFLTCLFMSKTILNRYNNMLLKYMLTNKQLTAQFQHHKKSIKQNYIIDNPKVMRIFSGSPKPVILISASQLLTSYIA
jgi:hypothetical protein